MEKTKITPAQLEIIIRLAQIIAGQKTIQRSIVILHAELKELKGEKLDIEGLEKEYESDHEICLSVLLQEIASEFALISSQAKTDLHKPEISDLTIGELLKRISGSSGNDQQPGPA